MVPLRVLSRTNLAGFAPSTSSISFTSFRLRTLDLSLRSFFDPPRLFSITSALFLQNTRGGIPPFILSLCVNSVRSASRRYPFPRFASPISDALVSTFRINTYKSVSKQTTLTSFRINTCEKQGGGGGLLLTSHESARSSGSVSSVPAPAPTRSGWQIKSCSPLVYPERHSSLAPLLIAGPQL